MIDEPQSNPTIRWLVDTIYGGAKPWGFLGFAGALLAAVALVAAYLLGVGDGAAQTLDRSEEVAAAGPPLAARIAVVALFTGAVALIAWQWLVRRYYRLMYGSAYHRS